MAEDQQRRSLRDIRSIEDAKECFAIPPSEAPNDRRRHSLRIAVSPLSGKLFISDYCNHAILVFNREREYITSFGTEGDGDGQLNGPYDIAVDAAGLVYVVDKNNDRIAVFREDGTFTRHIGRGQLHNPIYLAIHNQLLYIANLTMQLPVIHSRICISVYTLQGEHVSCIRRPEFKGMSCIAFTPDGYLCTCVGHSQSELLVLTSCGQYSRQFKPFTFDGSPNRHGPFDMLITNDGESVLMPDLLDKCIHVFSTHGSMGTVANLKPFHRIEGIKAFHLITDKEGNIFVLHQANFGHWQVAVF